MPEYENIIYEKVGTIVKISLNRPKKLNALTDDLMHELGAALDEVEADAGVRAVILRGEGRAFSAGYDLSPGGEARTTVQAWRDHATRSGRDVAMKIWDLRVPVIAEVKGYALGGGCDLVLVCDLAVMADDAKLGEPEVRMVSAPPTFILPWVVGMKKAKEFLLLGDMIDAEEALRLEIVNRVTAATELEAEVWRLAEKLASVPPVSIEYNKRTVNHAYETMGIKSSIAYGVETFTLLLMTQEAASFAETVEKKGLKAALEERDRAFEEKQKEG